MPLNGNSTQVGTANIDSSGEIVMRFHPSVGQSLVRSAREGTLYSLELKTLEKTDGEQPFVYHIAVSHDDFVKVCDGQPIPTTPDHVTEIRLCSLCQSTALRTPTTPTEPFPV